MNTLATRLASIGMVGLLLGACDNSMLSVDPLDELSDDLVWEDEGLIEAFVNELYRSMDHGYRENMLEAMTDNASYLPTGTDEYVRGVFSASALNGFGIRLNRYRWDYNYRAIRNINLFLESIDDSAITDEGVRDRMKGEAHFFRAFHYHQLLFPYGGVPLVTTAYSLDDDFMVARNTFEETVDFIVEEAERAAALLPLHAEGPGRASKGAALALKARVLHHAASDLFHDEPANELVGYVGGDQRERWRDAKNAAQDVMDLGIYELYRRYDDPTLNYSRLFLDNFEHEETIMSRFFLRTRDDGYTIGLRAGPNGYRNWATNTPIQQLVDAYEMIDGNEFDWNDPEHSAAPYENRDPRFYATISYDGARWSTRPDDVLSIEPHSIIQTFRTVTIHNPDGTTTVRPGLDTRNGPIEDWNGSWTGYHMIKAIDPDVPHHEEKQEVPWRYFRYAEILLNYAEASIELGEEDDARRAINLIRNRAGMPDITDSGDVLRQRYRNERRIEMAYEDQRFWDIRRWKIAPEVMNENGKAIEIHVEATDYTDRSTYFNYQYSVYEWQERNFHERMYFNPITVAELNRNPLLVQNPGY
jgi:starch-binding outer membrane protein, SusD/RagB family